MITPYQRKQAPKYIVAEAVAGFNQFQAIQTGFDRFKEFSKTWRQFFRYFFAPPRFSSSVFLFVVDIRTKVLAPDLLEHPETLNRKPGCFRAPILGKTS